MEKFTVEHDSPGVIVTFNISSIDAQNIWNDGGIVEINYKDMFKKLTGRKRNGSSTSKSTANSSSGGALPSVSSPIRPSTALAPSNRFELMISQLERKYLDLANHQNFSDHEGSLTSNSTCPSPAAPSPDVHEGKTVANNNSNANKKKKKKIVEEYDYSDNFIDDTEVLEEYEEAMRMKKMKTVHDGFFVSSGHLDVVKAPPAPKKVMNNSMAQKDKEKEKDHQTVSAKVLPSKSSDAKASEQKADKVDDKEKKTKEKEKEKEKDGSSKKEKTKKSNSESSQDKKEKEPNEKEIGEKEKKPKAKKEKANPDIEKASVITPMPSISTTESAPPSLTAALPGSTEVASPSVPMDVSDEPVLASATDDNVNKEKKVKTPVEKPEFQPCPEAQLAMDNFKTIVEQLGVVVGKKNSIFPKEWELPLLSLDKTVLTHHPAKEINKTKGYYEFIESVFGSQFSTGRIKTIIARLGFAQEARAAKELLDAAVLKVFEELKRAIIPCPENKQPGNKPPRKSKGGADIENDDDGDGVVETIDLAQGGSPRKEHVGSFMAPMAITDNSSTPQISQNVVTGTVSNDPVVILEPTNLAVNEVPKSKDITVKEELLATRYEFFCKWTIPLRQLLLSIEDLSETWIRVENKYRDKLTVVDKKDMEENDVSVTIFYSRVYKTLM